VDFRFRADCSWMMRRQFDELAGVVDFWCCSAGIFSFYPEAPAMLKGRGDKLWLYGRLASADGPLSAMIDTALNTWMVGAGGVVYWLTTSQGRDPWFRYDGGRNCMIYSGSRFGLERPLAPMRLKIQRNIVQDLTLLDALAKKQGEDVVRQKVAALGGSSPAAYWSPDAPAKKIEPWEWTNRSIHQGVQRRARPGDGQDGRWWLKVREYIHGQSTLLTGPGDEK